MLTIAEILSQELNQKLQYIENVIALIDEGNTIPFIARYRKESHGSMDDTTLRTLNDRLTYLRNLAARKEEVKNAIANQEKLTDELALAIDNAKTLAEVEDLYRPYKQKRRTRATMAKEKGLEPLAQQIFDQTERCPLAQMAEPFIDPEKGVETVEDALAGANDIIAEWIADDAAIRKELRELTVKKGNLRTAAGERSGWLELKGRQTGCIEDEWYLYDHDGEAYVGITYECPSICYPAEVTFSWKDSPRA